MPPPFARPGNPGARRQQLPKLLRLDLRDQSDVVIPQNVLAVPNAPATMAALPVSANQHEAALYRVKSFGEFVKLGGGVSALRPGTGIPSSDAAVIIIPLGPILTPVGFRKCDYAKVLSLNLILRSDTVCLFLGPFAAFWGRVPKPAKRRIPRWDRVIPRPAISDHISFLDFGSEGCRFKSCRTRHIIGNL